MADSPWTHTNIAVKIDKRGGGKKQPSLSLNLLNSVFSVKAALTLEAPISALTCRAQSHPLGFHKLQITSKAGNIDSLVYAELPGTSLASNLRYKGFENKQIYSLSRMCLGWLTVHQQPPGPTRSTLPREVLGSAPSRETK